MQERRTSGKLGWVLAGACVAPVVAVCVAGALPVWSVWFVGGGEAIGSRGTLWRAVEVGSWSWGRLPLAMLLDYQGENALRLAVVVTASAALGAALGLALGAARAGR